MGSRFKMYDDRQFCNGHRTVTMGKPVGYLVDGPLREEPNLKQLMEARAQVGGNYLTRIATDENDRTTWYWTASPRVGYGSHVRLIYPAGVVNYNYADSSFGVAPACWINL